MTCIPVRRGYWGNNIGQPHTVPIKVTGKCGSVTVRLIPAPRGAGIVAARVPKKVLQMAGIDDCYTASRGSTKTLGNFVKVCPGSTEECQISHGLTRSLSLSVSPCVVQQQLTRVAGNHVGAAALVTASSSQLLCTYTSMHNVLPCTTFAHGDSFSNGSNGISVPDFTLLAGDILCVAANIRFLESRALEIHSVHQGTPSGIHRLLGQAHD